MVEVRKDSNQLLGIINWKPFSNNREIERRNSGRQSYNDYDGDDAISITILIFFLIRKS